MLDYTGIRVRDLARSRRFYIEGLGLRLSDSSRVAAGGVRELLVDPESGARLELNYYPDDPAYTEGSELDHLAFAVDHLQPAIDALLALGGRLRLAPFDEGGRRQAFVADPDGIWVKLFERGGLDAPPTSRAMD